MPVVSEELWKNPGHPGMIVITSHATLLPDGRLRMDDSIAREAVRRIPNLDRQCGEVIRAYADGGVYGFLPVRPSLPEQRVIGFGLFQTQVELNSNPDPELIKYSMEGLRQYLQGRPNLKIRMNYPGLVSTRSLPPETVAPLLLPLPPTLTVCHEGELEPHLPTHFPGFKTIYLEVERMLQEGRQNQATEYLLTQGFDLQSALEQVSAVQRLLESRRTRHPTQQSSRSSPGLPSRT